jgi:hypothetical protein
MAELPFVKIGSIGEWRIYNVVTSKINIFTTNKKDNISNTEVKQTQKTSSNNTDKKDSVIIAKQHVMK